MKFSYLDSNAECKNDVESGKEYDPASEKENKDNPAPEEINKDNEQTRKPDENQNPLDGRKTKCVENTLKGEGKVFDRTEKVELVNKPNNFVENIAKTEIIDEIGDEMTQISENKAEMPTDESGLEIKKRDPVDQNKCSVLVCDIRDVLYNQKEMIYQKRKQILEKYLLEKTMKETGDPKFSFIVNEELARNVCTTIERKYGKDLVIGLQQDNWNIALDDFQRFFIYEE